MRRQTFFCLLTFLAYLLLPLAHQWDLASHAPRCGGAPGITGETSGLDRLSLPPVPGKSRHHHHDRSTCPLCQAALGPVKLAITSSPAILPAAPSGLDFRPPEPAALFSSRDYFQFACRAPPSLPCT